MPRPIDSSAAGVRAVAAPVALLAAAIVTTPALAQQFTQTTASAFSPATLTEYTNAVDAADIDGDGDLDLIFANGGNFGSPGTPQVLRIFINQGLNSGVFNDESVARTGGITGRIRGVAIADIERDGDLDMLLSEDFLEQPRLLINDGTGVFTDETVGRIPIGEISSTRAQFGDLDEDGDLDIYINAGGSNRFGCGQNRVWINDGTGVFDDQTSFRHPIGNVCEPMDVILGDLDGDFDLDVRTGNRGTNNSKVYLNRMGVLTESSNPLPGDSACYSYDLGDMDGDGDLDMIGANAGPSNRELLLLNDGDAGFTNVSSRISPNTTGDDNDSKFVDLDNDGDLDLIVAALFQSREKIYINDGAGNFALDTTRISSVNDATLDLVLGDFDGDGDYDLVTAQGEGGNFTNRYYTNTGPADTLPPTFSVERVCRRPEGDIVIRAAVRDALTGDRGTLPQSVQIAWSLDGGPDTIDDMHWIGHDLWRVVVPQPPVGSSFAYRVLATDQVGNDGESGVVTLEIGSAANDINGDCQVGTADLLSVLSSWGPCKGCPADLDGSGTVDLLDLLAILSDWD